MTTLMFGHLAQWWWFFLIKRFWVWFPDLPWNYYIVFTDWVFPCFIVHFPCSALHCFRGGLCILLIMGQGRPSQEEDHHINRLMVSKTNKQKGVYPIPNIFLKFAYVEYIWNSIHTAPSGQISIYLINKADIEQI